MDAAREAVAWLERHATYTRTGHHSAQTGEWRDGDGLVAGLFLHHISRDGDPHLHVHVAVWNRVRRADRGADEETAYQRAAGAWLADHLQGKDVLLLAGSNAEAAKLARRVQSRLAELGKVGAGKAALSDGNHAGAGDLIRARLNTEIDAGGQRLTNRDTLKVTSIRGPEVTVRRQRQEIHADYESWSGKTRKAREVAGKAKAELQRRGLQPREPEQSLVEWNRQFENDLAAVDRAIARERRAALDAGQPWPPERQTLERAPDPDAGARRVIAERQRDGYLSHITTTEPKAAAEPGRQPAPEHVSELENEAGASGSSRPEAISGRPEPEPHEEPAADVGQPGNRAARLDELQTRADEAAQRIATDEAEQRASAEYIARIEHQAQAEPQPDWSAERDDAEMEL